VDTQENLDALLENVFTISFSNEKKLSNDTAVASVPIAQYTVNEKKEVFVR
jgi:hypothetical protein